MKKLLVAVLLTACAHARAPGAPPDTEVTVVDETGDAIPGEARFWSRAQGDQCSVSNQSCDLSLPAGDYSFTFRKVRAGSVGGSIGGSTGGERGAGCLRARVHLVPGTKVVCKKRGEFNCAKGANETMDCGPAAAPRGEQPGDDEPAAAR